MSPQRNSHTDSHPCVTGDFRDEGMFINHSAVSYSICCFHISHAFKEKKNSFLAATAHTLSVSLFPLCLLSPFFPVPIINHDLKSGVKKRERQRDLHVTAMYGQKTRSQLSNVDLGSALNIYKQRRKDVQGHAVWTNATEAWKAQTSPKK